MGVSCRFCRKSFKTFKNDNFNRHLAICQGKKFQKINYPCMICNMDFNNITDYHVKNVETEIQGEKLLQAVKHLNAYNLE